MYQFDLLQVSFTQSRQEHEIDSQMPLQFLSAQSGERDYVEVYTQANRGVD